VAASRLSGGVPVKVRRFGFPGQWSVREEASFSFLRSTEFSAQLVLEFARVIIRARRR
jgi:hypothetical protein